MDKTTAQRLVRETFKAAFDKKRFRDFINELCNGFDEGKAQNMGVPDAFTPHVKSCQRLGTFESADEELADVLIVHLTESYKLERTRTALRDFVAHKLKRDESYKEAGLVAFVAPDSQSWRFSFVRMEYETKRDPKTGKIKPEERLTPARRYSYIVGVDEECHTAQSRFLALLQDTTGKPTLSQIEEAFSVESVTKEFFSQYAALFASTQEALDAIVKKDAVLRADFAAKNVSTVDFAKKLLGQIVFLYFIQKKGWLGAPKGGKWGDGPRNFLRKLADTAIREKKCLFNDVLEPLFYDTLATDRGHEAWCKTFGCRIPFLNGGLFEPLAGYDWEKTNISFSNSLFTNQERTPTGDAGSGILDVFDRYNFTVNEAEPLEKEVAIDPEMLGKVFENLIEENRRKGLGAFYTPREVVHYMCQESLINYLDTTLNRKGRIIQRADVGALIREGEQAAHYEAARKDGTVSYRRQLPKTVEKNAQALDDALASITVCDPAIGSGAFPVGMMTEIVRARMTLNPYFDGQKERTPYHFKRHAIQSSIYGVDIDSGAVEIAKLRLWLSLVVDEDDLQEIKPLPNLDYKVVTGNSLLGVEKSLFNEQLFRQLETLKPLFFEEADHAKKEKLKKQIGELIHELTNGKEMFDFEIYFSEVFHQRAGFDIVIANPPYLFLSGKGSPVQQLVRAGKHKDAEELKALFELYARRFPDSSKGCRDFYKWFVDLAFRVAKPGGSVSFITPNTYIVLKNYADLRQILLSENSVDALVDLGFGIFEVPIVPSAVFLARRCRAASSAVSYCDLKEIERPSLLAQTLSTLVTRSSLEVPIKGTELLLYKHPLAEKIYAKCPTTLHKYCSISEGEHNMVIDPERITPKPTANMVAAILDSELARLTPAKVIYVPKTDCPCFDRDLHCGDRFFLRKTGDRIIAAPAPSDELAVAHQNVYVGHAKTEEGSVHVIVGLLNSSLLTFLYQNGIYGQKGRTLAQFRIYALYLLPLPELRSHPAQAIAVKVCDILRVKQRDVEADTSALEREIDELVYELYGLTSEEKALVQAAAK